MHASTLIVTTEKKTAELSNPPRFLKCKIALSIILIYR